MDASSGKLVWSSHSSPPPSDSSSNTKSSSTSSNDIVVLQREDYFVQHLSASTGNQVWNVTLGRFSAPNFGLSKLHSGTRGSTTSSTTGNLMIDDDGIEDRTFENEDDPLGMMMVKMPLISFDEHGRMLTAMDQKTRRVQWRRQLPHVIAQVYGLYDGMWVPLTIVETEDSENLEDDDDMGMSILDVQQLLLPPSNQDDEIYQLLLEQQLKQTHAAQPWTIDTSIGLYHPPLAKESNYYDRNSDEARIKQQHQQDGNGVADPISLDDSRRRPDVYKCVQPGTPGCEPDFYVTVPSGVQQTPIASVPVNPPDLRPSGGLFLTWPILAGIVLTAIAGAFGLMYMYLKKKKEWLVQAAASTPVISHRSDTPKLSPLSLDRHLSVPIEGIHHHLRDSNSTSSIASPHVVTRSISMPVLIRDKSMPGADKGSTLLDSLSPGDSASLQQGPSNTVADNNTSPVLQLDQVSPMLKSVPTSLEGIPLVRYSRYRSEFKELSPLGKGGFGSVFECQNLLDGRKYAVKKVPIQLFDDPRLTRDRLQRVLREVKILALLDHPNIVRYYTAWMEVEESTDECQDNLTAAARGNGDEDFYTSSKFLSKRYSSSLLLTTTGLLDEDRPSRMMTKNRRKVPPQQQRTSQPPKANPLGNHWNAFAEDMSEFSLEKRQYASVESLSEYGFHFERAEHSGESIHEPNEGQQERNNNNDNTSRKMVQFEEMHQQQRDDHASSSCSSYDGSCGTVSVKSDVESSVSKTPTEPKLRHILYIQMQLCGQKTLANFLSNPKARSTPDGTEVDIHYALKLFHHVAMGVKYVHSQDLIHRDLKPNNCFMDDSGIVKVGDFGLSRETNNDMDTSLHSEDDGSLLNGNVEENTAGVGTRAYASPEQINGSDYDNSTDIYSLGFILFELTFQMSTGMERHIMFSRLRQGVIPDEWATNVAGSFPILNSMLSAMLSPIPSERPSADDVVRMMDKLLGEFTIQSLDQSLQDQSSTLLLRVEAEPSDHVLNRTMQLIKDSAPGVKIDQYGLRSGGDFSTIIEFALSGTDQTGLARVLSAMKSCPDIKVARQVASKTTVSRELSYSATSGSEYTSD
jgi:serine/threonine protein kinase